MSSLLETKRSDGADEDGKCSRGYSEFMENSSRATPAKLLAHVNAKAYDRVFLTQEHIFIKTP